MSIDLISTKIDFLESIGCGETMHSGRTLLEHLIGVYKVLDEGFAPLHVCDVWFVSLSLWNRILQT